MGGGQHVKHLVRRRSENEERQSWSGVKRTEEDASVSDTNGAKGLHLRREAQQIHSCCDVPESGPTASNFQVFP